MALTVPKILPPSWLFIELASLKSCSIHFVIPSDKSKLGESSYLHCWNYWFCFAIVAEGPSQESLLPQ